VKGKREPVTAHEVLGSLSALADYVKTHRVDLIYLTLPMASQPRILRLLEELRDTTASIYFTPDIFLFDLIQARVDTIGGMPVLAVCETPFYGLNGLIKRVSDVVLASAILALILPVMLAIAIVIIPGNSRIVRGAVMSAKQNRYVEAAQAIGCRHPRIILGHILPNVTAPILVIASIWLGNAILIEATLSFLGVGTQPPTPSWGLMLSSTGRAFMEQAPWLAIFPGLAISLAVLGFNLFGDTLRDAWDPKLRRN